MEQIKFNNKMEGKYQDYIYSNKYALWQCYGSYSHNKREAFDYCQQLMKKHNGRGGKIISYNQMVFTYGFIFEDENGNTCFAYITRDYDRYCIIRKAGDN